GWRWGTACGVATGGGLFYWSGHGSRDRPVPASESSPPPAAAPSLASSLAALGGGRGCEPCMPQHNRALPDLRADIARYALCDVYNMDETGVFYCMAPDYTIAQQPIEGRKKDKVRLTLAFTANADGSHKLQPLILGHARQPCCFKRGTAAQLGFYLCSNKKVWMKDLDRQMHTAGRKILLLIDNAPSHILDNFTSTNVTVRPLLPNTTSKIQPMDAGIIAAFKRRYRRYHLQNAIDKDERGKTKIYAADQLTAMQWSIAAWDELSPETIKNCFRHTGLFTPDGVVPEAPVANNAAEDNIDRQLKNCLQQLPLRNPMAIDYLLNPAEENEVHIELSDEKIIELVQNKDDDDEANAVDANEAAELEDPFSKDDKLQGIQAVCSMLDISRQDDRKVHDRLRSLQYELRPSGLVQPKNYPIF
ncbi:MAG: DDE superfamily endonuclease-domain-containing protein, partial [Olpidium bornovanus]